MKHFRLVIPFVVLAFAILILPIPDSGTPGVKHITLDAAQFEFLPGRLSVNQGDHVIITLAASDVVHGFYLDGYGIEERVEPGLTKSIEFVADQAGKFRFRCSVPCGSFHPFMIGELVVGSNIPFWRATGLVGVGLAGVLVYLWKSTGVTDGTTQKAS